MANKEKISEGNIEHLAKLSRLGFRDEEKEGLVPELARILDYVSELEKVNTAKVEPLAGGTDLFNVTRENVQVETFESEVLLEQAPVKEKGFIKVPRILE